MSSKYEKELEIQNEQLREMLESSEIQAEKNETKDFIYSKALYISWSLMKSIVKELHKSTVALTNIRKEYDISWVEVPEFYGSENESERIAIKYMKKFLEREIGNSILEKSLEEAPEDDIIYQEFIDKLKYMTENYENRSKK